MAKGNSKHYVSFWFWVFAMLVMAIPCVGIIMIVVWAFTGDNESRKNFFRAWIAWFLFFTVVWLGLLVLGFWPTMLKHIQIWIEQLN